MTKKAPPTDAEREVSIEHDAVALQEHRAERETAEKPTVGVAKPAAEPKQKPLDLAHALRPAYAPRVSRPTDPSWAPPPLLLGEIVAYVQNDGQDTQARVLRLDPDGTAILLVAVGDPRRDDVYQQQVGGVPLGRAGEVGTWHEVEE